MATPTTRRLRIFRIDHTISDAYLVLLGSDSSKSPSYVQSDTRFLGRRVNPHSIDLSRVRLWLTDCLTKHQECHDPRVESGFDELYDKPGFRVIDVNTECVVSGVRGPYLALSYVWGFVSKPDMALQSKIARLSTPGGLAASRSGVPRTILEAMRLTRLLEFQYL